MDANVQRQQRKDDEVVDAAVIAAPERLRKIIHVDMDAFFASVEQRETGIAENAKGVVAEGADAAVMTRSIPIDKMLSDAFLAYGQNGEAIRPEQGSPLRLLLPGYEGNMNIKWVRRIQVSESPFMTREETSKYTDLKGNG